MAVTTTVATWTFPDSATRDGFWQKYCDFYSIPYIDAADAEAKGVAEIKSQVAQVYANKVAIDDAEAAKQGSFAASLSDASGY